MFALDDIVIPGIKPVSLVMQPGECIGLSGESGCGKSRLMRAIADLDEHDGDARLDDTAASSVPAHQWRKQVALLPAESQWWSDSIGEHFTQAGMDLSVLGFDADTLDWQVSRCSSGERQRLGILRLLANQPDVLLLDEPTANLDPDNTIRVEQLVRDYLARHRACCIWVSHNRLQMERVADRRFEFRDDCVLEVAD